MVYTSLKFLHGRSLLHNDIRLSNVLVSKRWSPTSDVFKSTTWVKLKGYQYSRVPKKQKIYRRLWSVSSHAFSESSSPGKPQSPVKASSVKGKADTYKADLTIITAEIDVEDEAADGSGGGDDMNSRKTDMDIYVDPILTNNPIVARKYPFAADFYAFGILIRELCTFSWSKSRGKGAEGIDGWLEGLLPLKTIYKQLTDPQISNRPTNVELLESTMNKCWEDCWVKQQ